MIISVEEVLKATGGEIVQGERGAIFRGISTDSRTIGEGELFIALKGPRFDGHHFVLHALEKRAGGVMIESSQPMPPRGNQFHGIAVITVKNTLQALGDLARDRRRKYNTPVIALTGSNGKTTTKEMISACLQTTLPLIKTKGNLNNLIGLPLTLLQLTEREKVVVLEMGMNVPGEIRRLTDIAEPDVGLITNIQPVHLEGVGSLERIQEEKGSLFRRMRRDGTVLVNRDDPRVAALAGEFLGKKITFGIKCPADVMARAVRINGEGTSFQIVLGGKEEMEITLRFLGRHFVLNALSAIAAATLFGVDLQKAKEALEHLDPYPMRMEVHHLEGGKTLINDTYNANPTSMAMALKTVAEVKGRGRAIAVLGDMLEMGEDSQKVHIELGKKVQEFSVDLLITLGKQADVVVESAIRHGFPKDKARPVESHAEAVSLLKQVMEKGDWILIKGSRGMAMERIVEGLREGRD